MPRPPYRLLPVLFALFLLGSASTGFAAAPSNDDIVDARVLPPGFGSTNAEATDEPGEPDHAGNPASHSVWFHFTAPADGSAELSTCGSDLDTVLAVYTGPADVTALTPVTSDDNSGEGVDCTAGDSKVGFEATAGTTYRIVVDGKNGAIGTYQVFVRSRPVNADFGDATELEGSVTGFSGRNDFAGKEPLEPNHAGDPGGNSVWGSWTAGGNGTATIETCQSSLDTLLAVYTGSAVDSLTPVPGASADDTAGCGDGTQSRVSFPVTTGTIYAIAVDGKAGAEGGYSVDILGPPLNDLFASAQELGNVPIDSGGNNERAGVELDEGNHAGVVGGRSVWYEWTADDSGPFVVSTCNTTFDTLLAVYTGSTVATKTEVEADDDGGTCGGGASELSFEATEEMVYRIAVDGKAGAEGSFDIRLARDNDDFADAALLGGTSENYNSTTTGTTTEPGEPDHAGELVRSGSAWFRWTAPVSGQTAIEACAQGNFDPLLAVYTGSAVNALTLVPFGSNDDGGLPNCNPEDSAVAFAATAGTTYRIAVDGKGAGEGGFTLNLLGSPDPDEPDTLILSGPSGPTPSADPTFTYAGDPGFDVAFFVCRLDSTESADFQKCPRAGKSFSGLADGPHTFEVGAFDFDAKADQTPAIRSFTVDTLTPDTTILSGPSGLITTSSAEFTYAGSSGGTALGFECRLDDGAFSVCPASGASFSGVADGSHSFAVRAVDAAGNTDGSPAARTFSVDTRMATPPPQPPAEDLCTPAREKLKAAKAKLRKARAADRPDEERIDRLKRKVKKLKAKVAALCAN